MPAPSPRRRVAGVAGALGVLGSLALAGLGAAPATADDAADAADAHPGLVLDEATPDFGVLQPRSAFGLYVTFTNTGSAPLHKVWVTYTFSHGLGVVRDLLQDNCLRYEEPSSGEQPATRVVQCEFDQAVEPGVLYAPMEGTTMRAFANAMDDQVRVMVSSYPPGPDDHATTPVRGTQPAESLVEVDGTPAPPGSAAHEDWDAATVPVTTRNTADFRVAGAHLKGAVGDTVPLAVAFTNSGPAWVAGTPGTPAAHVRVTVPRGTSVVDAPALCRKLRAGTYDCGTAHSWVDENSEETYGFRLRIDKAVPGAEGSVAFDPKYPRPFDHVASDDRAPILLDVPGAQPDLRAMAAGTPTPSSAPRAQLAATGSGAALPLAASAGALLLGAGGVLAAHRRTARRR